MPERRVGSLCVQAPGAESAAATVPAGYLCMRKDAAESAMQSGALECSEKELTYRSPFPLR